MTGRDADGWAGMDHWDWNDHEDVTRRLDAGADPERWGAGGLRPLHRAAVFGSPEVVAERARRVADVDALEYGDTALWEAVVAGRAPAQFWGWLLCGLRSERHWEASEDT